MNIMQPVDPGDLLITFLAAAGVIFGGVGYALFYAAAKLQEQPKRLPGAAAAFILLTICVLVLMKTTHLDGIWQILALLLLLGYLMTPLLICYLHRLTHTPHHREHH